MRSGYVFLVSLAAMPLVGWPLLAHPKYRRLSGISRLTLSWAVGAVFLSFWMTAFAYTSLPWHLGLLLLLGVLTALLLRLFLKRDPPVEREQAGEPRWSAAEKLAILLATLAVALAFIAAASGAATSVDLLMFWGPKAQAFAAARTVDTRVLSDPLLDYLHPSYPPLVTNLYALGTIAAGRLPWGAATLTFPLLLALLSLALPGVLRRAAPRPMARACSALIVSALGFCGSAFDVAGNGEPFLWLFESLAIAVLVGSDAVRLEGQLLAGFLLAGAATAKVEGLPFVAAAGAVFLTLRRKQIRLGSATALLFLPTVCSVGIWFAFGASRRIFYGYASYGRLFDVHWDRLPLVLSEIGSVLWSAGWALPYLLPLAALIAAPRKSRLLLLPVGVSAVLAAFFVFTYLHAGRDPWEWISWSAGRVFSPIAALLTIAGLCRRTAMGGGNPSSPDNSRTHGRKHADVVER